MNVRVLDAKALNGQSHAARSDCSTDNVLELAGAAEQIRVLGL